MAGTIGSSVQYANDRYNRRGVVYRSLTCHVVNVPCFRFLTIRVLHCVALVSKDLRQFLKRFTRHLFGFKPIRLYHIAINVDVLLLLANALHVPSLLPNACKEDDFMFVANAHIIIDCMTEIARADYRVPKFTEVPNNPLSPGPNTQAPYPSRRPKPPRPSPPPPRNLGAFAQRVIRAIVSPIVLVNKGVIGGVLRVLI